MGLYNKRLYIKKLNNKIQSANLYTDKSNVRNNYLILKDDSNIIYVALDINGDIDLKINKNGNIFKMQNTNKYKMSELYPDICQTMTSLPNDTNWYSYMEQFNNLKSMFAGCYQLISIPQLDTSKVNNMSYMFENCSKLAMIPVLDVRSIASIEDLKDMIKSTKITNITFKNKRPDLQITPQLLGKSNVTIQYI